jgi:hypothetical protein
LEVLRFSQLCKEGFHHWVFISVSEECVAVTCRVLWAMKKQLELLTKRCSIMPQWPGILEIKTVVPEFNVTCQVQKSGI